jgi:hypothetical protein
LKKSIFLTFALILILLGLFFSYYPLSENQVLTHYVVENVITNYSTSQTLTLSTSKSSYATTIKDEEQFTEDDFETHIWATGSATGVTIFIDNILALNLKEGDQVSVFLSSPYDGRFMFSRGATKVKTVLVYKGDNSYEFAADKTGNYTIHYSVSGGPREAFPFKATVTVFHLSTQWTTGTWVFTSTIKQTETILSTKALTSYSTTSIAKPLENGHVIAYVLWGIAAVIVVVTLTYVARSRFAPRYKFCHNCGAKLKAGARFCDECGTEQG